MNELTKPLMRETDNKKMKKKERKDTKIWTNLNLIVL